MADEDFKKILKTFDLYLQLIENPSMIQNFTRGNISKAFNCGMFVENAIERAKTEDQMHNFENHLCGHWKKMNRTCTYTCSELVIACDILLEVYMKSTQVSTEVIDELLQLYVQNCGRKRLNSFFDNMLADTLSANTLINSMIGLGLSNSVIEDEARIIAWENIASSGHVEEIDEAIHQMIDDGHVKKVLEYLWNLSDNSAVEKLIIQNLIRRMNAYEVTICLEIIEVKRKLLRRLLKDSDFLVSFMDAVFYFGRNMYKDENNWKSDNQFTYRHLLKIINNLLTITDKVGALTSQRLSLAKVQVGGAIWLDVEKNCTE